jgi:energy-converting hydrogenase Eha subunit B
MTTLSFSGGLVLALLLLVLLVAIPLKVGAHLAGAQRNGILWCALAAVVGVLAGDLTAHLLGGYLGGSLAAFLGFIIAIRYLLGTSIAGALGLTIIAFVVSLLGVWALAHFSFTPPMPSGGWAI